MSQTLLRGLVALSAMNVEDDLAEQSSRYREVIVVGPTKPGRRDKEGKIEIRLLSVSVQQSPLKTR